MAQSLSISRASRRDVARFSLSFLIPTSQFLIAVCVLSLPAAVQAQAPVEYRFSFPEPEHHWMQVEATFPDVGTAPLELRMSVSSPGRYASHDFAKNVYDVEAFDAGGRAVPSDRPDPGGWTVTGHGGAVRVRYKVFGDRVDGTYLAIDPSHAHVNMPAALLWARGLDDRPARLVFEPPAGRDWRVFTQLNPGATPWEFTAPNFQYLMDSPVEFGPGALREVVVEGQRIRVALHHDGSDADLDAFVADIAKIVQVQGRIFGEFPPFEPGHYTFLADYLPYAIGDGMEHRNSTVLTSGASLRSAGGGLRETAAHEFFHAWNVERIRPRSLEPFDFERTNLSGELWLGEGFTQYYGVLTMSRAGLADLAGTALRMHGFIESVAANPARLVRSAEDMSRMAPFTDGGVTADRTNWQTTVISYYSHGAAIALALDLSLRARSEGAVTLDDYMRALWRVHGAPGGRPGHVDRPYTMADLEARLTDVSGDAAFARDFFARFIRGREAADYASLVARAGFVLRPRRPGAAWIGEMRLEARDDSVRIASPPPIGSPAWRAGLDVGDVLRRIDDAAIRSVGDLPQALARRVPGGRLSLVVADRSGATRTVALTLEPDPARELVPVERAGGNLSPEQRAFRSRWLN